MTKENPVVRLARLAAVAAVYFVLTIAIAPIAFGPLQFRISEILVFLCFFRKDYCISLIVGCALANLFSPFGWYDLLFGTLHTAVSVLCIAYSPRLWIAGIFPVVFSFIIGFELALLGEGPFWLMFLSVMAGEALAVFAVGLPVFILLSKNKGFLKTIGAQNEHGHRKRG
ncbi:MAG TPA: QueT transporter family protein [Clostridiales bacterium]|nr:QueT transporter family protein [Clostridiales bacterium]